MATYDILEADGIIEGIFTFDELRRAAMAENSPIAPIFEKLGYETRIAFTTLATMGLILFFHLVRVIMLPIFYLIKQIPRCKEGKFDNFDSQV